MIQSHSVLLTLESRGGGGQEVNKIIKYIKRFDERIGL